MFIQNVLLICLGIPWFTFGCSNEQELIGCFGYSDITVTLRRQKRDICSCIDYCRNNGHAYAGFTEYYFSNNECLCVTETSCSWLSLVCGNCWYNDIQLYFIEAVFEDKAISFDELSSLLNNQVGSGSASIHVDDNNLYTYSNRDWEYDEQFGDVQAISLQVSSEETDFSSSTDILFSIAVGYTDNQDNSTILVALQDSGNDGSYINYMISDIINVVVYDSDGKVQQAQIKFNIQTKQQVRNQTRWALKPLPTPNLPGVIVMILHFQNTCKFVAFLLHFLYLAVFAWMVLEAAYLYYKIINKALNSVGTKARYVIVATAWALPVIVAGLTLLANDDYLHLSACWLSYESNIIWAFVVPVIIIVLINSVIMAMVVRVMWQRARTHDASNPNFKRLRVSVRGMLILLPLLGLTWAFGLLAFGDAAVAMQYLFVICNTLQGTFIFINFCLVDHEVRKLLIGIYEKNYNKKNPARVVPSDTTTTGT